MKRTLFFTFSLILFVCTTHIYAKEFFVGVGHEQVSFSDEVEVVKNYPLLNLILVRAANEEMISGAKFVDEFKKKNFYSKKNSVEGDTGENVKKESFSDLPWGIRAVKAHESWELFKQRNNVKVMVFDTGIDKNHPAFTYNLIEAKDFTGTRLSLGVPYRSYDIAGHGTHVSGTIAGNSSFLKGVIPWASLYMAKVCIFDCGSIKTFVDAFHWALEENIDVINMSLSLGIYPQRLVNHVFEILEKENIVLVASAGNNGQKSNHRPIFPGKMLTSIAVGAIDCNLRVADFSAYGDEVSVVAPGVDIESASLMKGINSTDSLKSIKSGTSMAAPHVAGIAALIRSHYPNLTAKEVREAIIKSSQLESHMKNRQKYGSGLVNAVRALEYAGKL